MSLMGYVPSLQLIKLVEAIYEKKIEADSVDDAQENERQNACEFMYDFMLNSYGLKGLAESAVHGVFKKIKQMMISKGIEKTHKARFHIMALSDCFLLLCCMLNANMCSSHGSHSDMEFGDWSDNVK